MNCNHLIYQILHTWIDSLEIDGQSGESIVTIEDIDRLHSNLTAALNTPDRPHYAWSLPFAFLSKCFGHFRYTVTKARISVNLFCIW